MWEVPGKTCAADQFPPLSSQAAVETAGEHDIVSHSKVLTLGRRETGLLLTHEGRGNGVCFPGVAVGHRVPLDCEVGGKIIYCEGFWLYQEERGSVEEC